MRLLLITQVMDKQDPMLGFMHRWVDAFSNSFDSIHVVCLKEGEHDLPQSVQVHSLGKTKNARSTLLERIRYMFRFLRYVLGSRNEYDTVLVHMNQEYILLAGWLWKLLGKPVYLWRNHYQGSFLTGAAVLFSRKVFCTSRHSYTARYRKTVLMPVGIDTDFFRPMDTVSREARSLLFLGRIAPSKHPDELIGALADIEMDVKAHLYGGHLPEHAAYHARLKEMILNKGLEKTVMLKGGVSNDQTPQIYSAHEIFVNLSDSGMFDKTIFEAMACGCVVLVRSEDLSGYLDERQLVRGDNLSEKLSQLLSLSDEEKRDMLQKQEAILRDHTLKKLTERLKEEMA